MQVGTTQEGLAEQTASSSAALITLKAARDARAISIIQTSCRHARPASSSKSFTSERDSAADKR